MRIRRIAADEIRLKPSQRLAVRTAWFLGLLAVASACFWPALAACVHKALRSENYSHILFVPLLSAYIIYLRRKTIFAAPQISQIAVVPALVASALIFATRAHWLDPEIALSLRVAAVVCLWLSGFMLCFGWKAFRVGSFPLLLLLLCIPLPAALVDQVIAFLQHRSAVLAQELLALCGVPSLREGLLIYLPGLTIEVAKECSGIRSTTVLFILSTVVAYSSVSSMSARITLTVSSIPIGIFKNAVRIAVLSALSVYVNPGFLRGRLHYQGGVVFFLLGLGILMLEARAFRWLERRKRRESKAEAGPTRLPEEHSAAVSPV